MSIPKSSKDVFEKALDEKIESIGQCQEAQGSFVLFEGKSYGSCMPCPKIIGCETRRGFVQTVYGSMSKGDSGGFEF